MSEVYSEVSSLLNKSKNDDEEKPIEVVTVDDSSDCKEDVSESTSLLSSVEKGMSTSSSSKDTKTKKIEIPKMRSLTGARGIAAIYVIVYHFFSDFSDGSFPHDIFKRLLGHGYYAVVFFFQLSGFVNTIVNEARGTDYSSTSFKKRFWWRRVSRLAPVYFSSMIIFLPILVVAWPTIDVIPFDNLGVRIAAVATTLTGIQSWDPTVPLWRLWNYPAWAVSCEGAFYIMFPYCVPTLKKVVKSRTSCVATLVFFATAECVIWYGYTKLLGTLGFDNDYGAAQDVSYVFPLVRAGEFLVGIVLGLQFLKEYDLLKANSTTVGHCADALAVVTVGILACLPGDGTSPTEEGLPTYVVVSIMQPFCAVWLLLSAMDNGYVAKVLSHDTFVKLGELSYCTYIVQVPVMYYTLWAINEHDLGDIYNMITARGLSTEDPTSPILPHWSLPVVLVVTHVLGYTLYHYVEHPAAKYLSSLASKSTTKKEKSIKSEKEKSLKTASF